MEKELIIHAKPSEVELALLEDKVLVELHKDNVNNEYAVGDIYLGRVKKVLGGLNASFVDIGSEKSGFLHYLDLGAQFKSMEKFTRLAITGRVNDNTFYKIKPEKPIEKTGKISQVLSTGQNVLVQVVKEAISTKGPRITAEVSLAGRYIVLIPFSNKISVSQKIKNAEERKRLKRLISSICPDNFGVIIRTVAENKMGADLDTDMRNLIEKWNKIVQRVRHCTPPKKVGSELDRTSALLRDILNESFSAVHVNSSPFSEEIKSYVKAIFPNHTDLVKEYKGKKPIMEFFGIDKQIKTSFGKSVTRRGGVYLVIEHTEAMHVIDVNSGLRSTSDNCQDNALNVNLEAATEVARQLRLRDMGGIIVVDFIDMAKPENRKKLFSHLKTEMERDKAKHTILPPTKFGLIQITRQRVRPVTDLEVLEKCPSCDGTGRVRSSLLFKDELERKVHYLFREQNEKQLTLRVNPMVYAFLTKGFPSIRMRWYFELKKWITIIQEPSYQVIEYRFFNRDNQEIKL